MLALGAGVGVSKYVIKSTLYYHVMHTNLVILKLQWGGPSTYVFCVLTDNVVASSPMCKKC